jgi:transcriptional regulator with XRE-family HTH domain
MRAADLNRIAAIRADLSSGAARRSRLSAGIRVTEVAAVVGVTPQAVSQWESGRRIPDAARCLAYGRALAALAPKAA